MSKIPLPPPTSVYLNIVLPEEYRDKSPQECYRLLTENRDVFLWTIANEISKLFTSKPATDAFITDAHDASTVDAALAARNIVLRKGS
jgi:hypothetical protein